MFKPPEQNEKYPWLLYLPWQTFYCKRCAVSFKIMTTENLEDQYKRFVLYHRFCIDKYNTDAGA